MFTHVSDILRRLSYLGSERAAEDYCDEVVDGDGRLQYLDKVHSVSALNEPPEPLFVDELLDEQYRRFLKEVTDG